VNLKQDPTRTELPETGIFVRAQVSQLVPKFPTSEAMAIWGNVDINHLDRQSLITWMDDKDKAYLMSLALFLLNHEPTHIRPSDGV
jgi:hypothetical protein